VGAVALVLAGAAAGHADARPRYVAVYYANSVIDTCFAGGGDPYVYEFPGSFSFYCVYDGATFEEEYTYDIADWSG
jgi:hypothetical protein